MSPPKARLFDSFEIGSDIPKEEYEAAIPDLRVNLVNLQYDLEQAGFSVMILLVGDDLRDVNELVDVLHEWLDARFLHTRAFLLPKQEEGDYPSYWRYWRAMPPQGRIGVYLGAWPLDILFGRLLGNDSDSVFERRMQWMRGFERSLTDDGTLIIKLWLHAPKSEAKKRLKRAAKDPEAEPYIGEEYEKLYEIYDRTRTVAEHLLRETSNGEAPWHIIESTNRRHRDLSAARKIEGILRERLDEEAARPPRAAPKPLAVTEAEPGLLDTVDLEAKLDRKEYKERLEQLQRELGSLVRDARDHFATVLAFEGWDAAGKGGVIRRLTKAMFARDYRVVPVAAPTDEEKARHYLWRFWRQLPRAGEVVIFDRTWYGRVLVERVEGFATAAEWRRAYTEINDFEEQLVDHGLVLCKFWLHIDPDEQLRRFEAREQTGYKKYKITDEDYRNREKRGAYTTAVNEMVARTSTEYAPWHLISANDKKWARIEVLETVIAALKKRLGTQ